MSTGRTYRIGDVVRLRRGFLGDPDGLLGYVYERYHYPGENSGISIITENGTDLGGFSPDEQDDYLEFINHSGYTYRFSNVIQLDRDFETLIKPLLTNQKHGTT